MFAYVTLGSNDTEKALAFYDEVLAELGIKRFFDNGRLYFYGTQPGQPMLAIGAAYDEGEVMPVELHDGGYIHLRKLEADYDPTDRGAAFSRAVDSDRDNEILTGLLYLDEKQPDLHQTQNMEKRPLNEIPYTELNPGADQLQALQAEFR